MNYFTEELWKGINGISDVYDIETADVVFQENILKYNEYFHTKIVPFLSKVTLELYEKYDGFHDMKIIKLQYEKNKFYIYGKTVHITFDDIKELHANIIGYIDTFGYMEIFYRKETNDFQVGILFSWEDSIYITCSSIIVEPA
ncbi:MAG: hypothetical protein E7391_00105 [Ruminococcaceae bacterium]|nr:hypothetical protein [Oscillospiraceae bacterium]